MLTHITHEHAHLRKKNLLFMPAGSSQPDLELLYILSPSSSSLKELSLLLMFVLSIVALKEKVVLDVRSSLWSVT